MRHKDAGDGATAFIPLLLHLIRKLFEKTSVTITRSRITYGKELK